MASLPLEDPRPPNHLYIFYDCEATGLEAHQDQIIEVAAVVNLRDSSTKERGTEETFQSLCYTERRIDPVVSEMTGLTNRDLRYEPRLPEVLHRFMDWVGEMVSRVTRERGEQCTPVLVAHGGFSLDFPMLMAGVERAAGGQSVVFSHPLYRKIDTLNLHFGDSYTTCKHLAEKNDPVMAGIEKKGQESLYQRFFHEDYNAHRALGDARALHRLFTQSPLRSCLDKLIMKPPRAAYDHWKAIQLTPAGLMFGKAKALVKSGVFLEHMQQKYNRSPQQFRHYLRSLGIHRPSPQLLAYFETHN
jgi:DNA polymerase III epsilon subunit-like protein